MLFTVGSDSPAIEAHNQPNGAETMDLSTNKWTVRSNYDFERQIYSAKSLYNRGQFIVFGGYNGYDPLSRVAAYNPKTNKWKSLGNMNSARSVAAVIFKNDEYFIAGGSTVSGGNSTDKCQYRNDDELDCIHQNPVFTTTKGESDKITEILKFTSAYYHIFEYKTAYCIKDQENEDNNSNSAGLKSIPILKLLTIFMLF